MELQPRHRTIVRALLCTLAAFGITGLIVYLLPGRFLGTSSGTGPVREASMPAALAIFLMLLLLAAIFVGLWFGSRKIPRFSIAMGVLLALAVPTTAYLGYEMWEYHEEPEFCAETCHVMETQFEQYSDPGTNAVMHAHKDAETGCLDCHSSPGAKGQVGLMTTSLRHVWKYWTGGYEEGYGLDANESIAAGSKDWVTFIPDENCLKCHGAGMEDELPDKHERYEKDCVTCHSPHDPLNLGYLFPEHVLDLNGGDCSECHDDLPDDMEVRMRGHSDLGEESCRECHVTHGLKDAANVKACTESGCHDADPANLQSLPSLDHATYTDAECADCHAEAHDLIDPSIEVMRTACTDCHTGNGAQHQSDLTAHSQANGSPCADCHKTHSLSEPDPLRGCLDSQCHATKIPTDPVHDAITETGCDDCHGTPHAPALPAAAVIAAQCKDCHSDAANVIKAEVHGVESCDSCHTVHSTKTASVTDCTECHGDTLAPHDETPSDACASCHGGAHETIVPPAPSNTKCQSCHTATPVTHEEKGCDTCHVTHATQLGGAADGTKDCTTCHAFVKDGTELDPVHLDMYKHNGLLFDADNDDAVYGDNCVQCHDLHVPGDEIVLRCTTCHSESGIANETTLDGVPVSQRNWTRQEGNYIVYHDGAESWTTDGRGSHVDGVSCDGCHNYPNHEYPGGEEGCTEGCHTWLDEPITEDGFTNSAGATARYSGSIEPVQLLGDGNTAHDTLFDITGCTGACHGGGGVEDPGSSHGTITACEDCHGHDHSVGDPHNTHKKPRYGTTLGYIDSVEGMVDAETGMEIGSTCEYCHGSGRSESRGYDVIAPDGGCYNCHLSGHDPSPVYWKPTGEAAWQSENSCADCHREDGFKPAHRITLETDDAECGALCHGDKPHETGATEDCLQCHSDSTDEHPETPWPAMQDKITAGECADCHQLDDPFEPSAASDPWDHGHLTCIECHGENGYLEAHATDLVDATDTTCTTCHDARHGFDAPPDMTQCLECHTSIETDGHRSTPRHSGLIKNDTGEIDTEHCTDCHNPELPLDDGQEHESWDHGRFQCTTCHVEGGEAPVEAISVTPESQRVWTRENGDHTVYHDDAESWTTEDRGTHVENEACDSCHTGRGQPKAYPGGDEGCTEGCHTWLDGDIVQEGFTNVDGVTASYAGTIEPVRLLGDSNTAHDTLFDITGCTGACHGGGGVEDPVSSHGTITACEDCHGHDHSVGDPHNTHKTPRGGTTPGYIDSVEGMVDAETGMEIGSTCEYCHGSGRSLAKGYDVIAPDGGCYNCHLSGHDPSPVYWEPTGEAWQSDNSCADCHREDGFKPAHRITFETDDAECGTLCHGAEPHEAGATEDCLQCHTGWNNASVHPATPWPAMADKIEAGACTDCHQLHDPLVPSETSDPWDHGHLQCVECHDGGGYKPAHSGTFAEGTEDATCTACHDPLHRAEAPVPSDCAQCHTAGDHAYIFAGTHNENVTNGNCEACHQVGVPAGDNAEPDPWAHGHLQCDTCHNGADAPLDTIEMETQSQRSWARESGAHTPYHDGAEGWVQEDRGTHVDDTGCHSCHTGKGMPKDYPGGEEGCTEGCHSWLDDPITENGFTNADGETGTFSGDLEPVRLLTEGPTAHSILFEQTGCTGACHGGIGPGGPDHGNVTTCEECHGHDKGPRDPHNSHKTPRGGTTPGYIDGNMAHADTDGEFNEKCEYCHGSGRSESKGYDMIAPDGGCYNCHLSGHDPSPVYWKQNYTTATGEWESTPSCVDCHDDWSQVDTAHGGGFTPGQQTDEDCGMCHTATPHADPLPIAEECQDCHTVGDHPHIFAGTHQENITNGNCEACHQVGVPAGDNAEPDPWDHGHLQCDTCHNGADAPLDTIEMETQSQRSWARESGARIQYHEDERGEPFPESWVQADRGTHVNTTGCHSCHTGKGMPKDYPGGEEGCTEGCHSWLDDPITENGFTNADGETGSFSGSIEPVDLLNGSRTAHTYLFEASGCTGECHGGIGPGAPSHGNVTACEECHPRSGPEGLHSTHKAPYNRTTHEHGAPGYIDGNMSYADTSGDFTDNCEYCHGSGRSVDKGYETLAPDGGCYNCHLSGHDPSPVFWKQDYATASGEWESGADCQSCHSAGDHAHVWPDAHQASIDNGECRSCHQSGDQVPSDTPVEDRPHGDLQCDTCHSDGGTAPVDTVSQEPRSQLSWARESRSHVKYNRVDHDTGNVTFEDPVPGAQTWIGEYEGAEGDVDRGTHIPGGCHDCHQGYMQPKAYPGGEEGCTTEGCHTWLDGTVTQAGFPNADGETPVYEGAIDPLVLMSETSTAHGDLYAENGCTGLCHIDAALEDPTADHGFVRTCETSGCHPHDGSPEDTHNTHKLPYRAPEGTPPGYIDGHMDTADVSGAFNDKCEYCHGSARSIQAGYDTIAPDGGCYNCHLSAHDPQVVYWKPVAAAPS